jgi:periplasmic mercuric ion binding protein
MKKSLLFLGLLSILAAPVWAKTNTVTLSVPTMDCPVCPITVKKALTKVHGVSAAEVSFDKRQAKVTFDNAKTSVDALIRATRDAGYPSTLLESAK